MTNKIIPSFRKSKLADRGKSAENAANAFLSLWAGGHAKREFNRLIDTKAAGRIVKAAKADFDFYYSPADQGVIPYFGLLEVKETKHDYRLDRAKVPQLPNLVKRMKCGGDCFVVVHHSEIKKWRAVNAQWLTENGDKGSWNLVNWPTFDTPAEALQHVNPHLWST